ncbi:CesT family type III secretion system chaperone [Variovorax sp. 770b2]|uniref:CesT family type III secretion system chaperone n=1 Tax=Variovorax sp. 770b2 TaxID=1566271 RepID=UPI000B8070AC|nr:CesT family type III secretion system chaperone [Variovorax sp. 770b2]
MSQQRLRSLLSSFCQATSVRDPEPILRSGNLTLRNIAFTIQAGKEVDPDGLYLYGDFGALPTGLSSSAVLQRLLEINLHLCAPGAPVLGYNPTTNRVLLIFRMAIDEVDAKHLAMALDQIAAYASQWREHHFLTTSQAAHTDASAQAEHVGALQTNGSRESGAITSRPQPVG